MPHPIEMEQQILLSAQKHPILYFRNGEIGRAFYKRLRFESRIKLMIFADVKFTEKNLSTLQKKSKEFYYEALNQNSTKEHVRLFSRKRSDMNTYEDIQRLQNFRKNT